jgi:hypothetical protein
MRFVKSFVLDLGLITLLVTGGVTLFLILAPLFGYLPYSDRPGPGWYGSFPALSLTEFTSNSLDMIVTGAFLGLLFLIPGSVAVILLSILRRLIQRAWLLHASSAILAAAISMYWMLGAGWYIAAGQTLVAVSGILGLLAGLWLAYRARPRALETTEPAPGV